MKHLWKTYQSQIALTKTYQKKSDGGQHATNLKGEMALFFITLREEDTADLHIDLFKMKV